MGRESAPVFIYMNYEVWKGGWWETRLEHILDSSLCRVGCDDRWAALWPVGALSSHCGVGSALVKGGSGRWDFKVEIGRTWLLLYIRAKKTEESKMSEVPERIMVSLAEKEWKLRSTFGRGENKFSYEHWVWGVDEKLNSDGQRAFLSEGTVAQWEEFRARENENLKDYTC